MSAILESMYEAARGLHRVGAMDDETMKKVEQLCLEEGIELQKDEKRTKREESKLGGLERMSAREIKALRVKHEMSQSVFAEYLNVKPITVKKWERGENSPGGPSLKLLYIIREKGLEPLEF